MGSRPWKEDYLNRLSERYSGKQVEVFTRGPVYDRAGALAVDGFELRADCKRVVGTYTGDSISRDHRHRYLTVNTAPLGMGPRDEGYFDYDRDILLTKAARISVGELTSDRKTIGHRP